MKNIFSFVGISLMICTLSACTIGGGGNQSSSSSSSISSANVSSVSSNDKISVTSPVANATVKSPLTVTGRAKGTWYFEASFPVRLLDANGNEIAVAPAQAQGDWMTEDFVPFSVMLTFAKPSTTTGMLMLEKDNPSGLPENDEHISVPVHF